MEFFIQKIASYLDNKSFCCLFRTSKTYYTRLMKDWKVRCCQTIVARINNWTIIKKNYILPGVNIPDFEQAQWNKKDGITPASLQELTHKYLLKFYPCYTKRLKILPIHLRVKINFDCWHNRVYEWKIYIPDIKDYDKIKWYNDNNKLCLFYESYDCKYRYLWFTEYS